MTPVSETDRPILGMVVGKSRTLMIDAGNSEAHAQLFIRELEKQGMPQPSFVALTHWHWDHIFGLSGLGDIVSISSALTKIEMEKLLPLSWSDEALAERVAAGTEIEFCATAIGHEFPNERNIEIVLPSLTFEGRLEIDLGGVTCVLQQVGGDHAADSVVVYVPQEKLLFLGDCMYQDIFSPPANYTVKRTLDLLDTLEAFEADTYVISHWKPISKEEFRREVSIMRHAARITEECQGRLEAMKQAYQQCAGRELEEDEEEILEYFANGYARGQAQN
nr:MBL fold metallo-hydrolase [Ectobacillus ponti]